MTAQLVFDILLALLVAAVAIAVVAVRAAFAGIVFFLVFGLLLAVAWVRLDAVDVALAEAAIGAGVTGVLLLRVLPVFADAESIDRRSPFRPGLLAGCAAVGVGLSAAVLALAEPTPGQGPLVQANLPSAGVESPVTAVLLNFRGYDTLLESVVLLMALVCVWSMTTNRAFGGRPGLPQRVRPGGVLAQFGRALPPVGILIGGYLVWAGGHAPGGAFQAGTVLAAVWLLAVLAGAVDAPRTSSRGLRLVLVAGPGLFLAIGTAGVLAGVFLGYPQTWAKTLIVAIEVGLAVSIAATLALLVAGPPERSS